MVEISLKTHSYLEGHKIDGRILFPATGYMFLVWKSFAKNKGTTFDQLPVLFESIQFHQATILQNEDEIIKFSVRFLEGIGEFEVFEGNSIVASGKIRILEKDAVPQKILIKKPIKPTSNILLSSPDTYKILRLRGYEYEGIFKGIHSADQDRKMIG